MGPFSDLSAEGFHGVTVALVLTHCGLVMPYGDIDLG